MPFRGDGDEWFANMEIEDFVKHIRSWYEDLASGVNIEDGGQFEPLRFEGYTGTLSYDYEQLSSEIEKVADNQKTCYSFLFDGPRKIIRLTSRNTWLLKTSGFDNEKYSIWFSLLGQSKESCDLYDTRFPNLFRTH